VPRSLTDYHAKYLAHELTKRCSADSLEKLAGALVNAQVDLNPHQVDAALFAFKSPLSKGAILAEAVCKLEGFRYAPSDSLYWQHGHSTERDFIYVTTQSLDPEQLQQLSDDVGESRTLLVMCAAFRGKADRWANLTVKKIPKAVLHRCEWGHDDYSLQVENLPQAPEKAGQLQLDF